MSIVLNVSTGVRIVWFYSFSSCSTKATVGLLALLASAVSGKSSDLICR